MYFNHLDKYGANTALISSEGVSISYGDMVLQADKIASNINKRCLVFLLCQNSVETVTAYVGFLRNNIVPLLLNGNIDKQLLNDLIRSYRPQYICLESNYDLGILGKPIYSFGDYALIELDYDIDYELFSELALLLTTSGSTGSPKLVRQSYQNIKSNTESIIKYLDIVHSDRAITTLPFSYTYGLSIVNTHLSKGASIILTDKTLMDKELWDLMKTHKATTFGGVPYIYEMLKKLRFERMSLPSIRYLTQAGGKLSAELAKEFIEVCEAKNIEFIIMYGQTEATARMSYLPWEHSAEKFASIGIAIPDGNFHLLDSDGNIIEEPEAVGELIYSGENVTLGYAENRFDLAHGDDNNGVLYTGDMAKRDKDGFYYVVGRKKRFLKIFGNRVNLDEIEGLLKKQAIECACTGKDDKLHIYITDELKISEVRAFLIDSIRISLSGFTIFVIDSIPRNESGKILYSELQ